MFERYFSIEKKNMNRRKDGKNIHFDEDLPVYFLHRSVCQGDT